MQGIQHLLQNLWRQTVAQAPPAALGCVAAIPLGREATQCDEADTGETALVAASEEISASDSRGEIEMVLSGPSDAAAIRAAHQDEHVAACERAASVAQLHLSALEQQVQERLERTAEAQKREGENDSCTASPQMEKEGNFEGKESAEGQESPEELEQMYARMLRQMRSMQVRC